MSWLNNIRNKPHAEKLRLIWIICAVAAMILIALWVLTSRLKQNLPKDTSLFQTLSRGIKNLTK